MLPPWPQSPPPVKRGEAWGPSHEERMGGCTDSIWKSAWKVLNLFPIALTALQTMRTKRTKVQFLNSNNSWENGLIYIILPSIRPFSSPTGVKETSFLTLLWGMQERGCLPITENKQLRPEMVESLAQTDPFRPRGWHGPTPETLTF